MAFDSSIRLKQLNQNEVSGFIVQVVGPIPSTGVLSGAFYPLNANPSSYITTGQTGAFANAAVTTVAINSLQPQILAYVAANYLPAGAAISGGSGTLVTVNGSANLTGANFVGVSGTTISLSGNTVLISSSGLNTSQFAQLYTNNIFTGSNTFSGNLTVTGNYSVNFLNKTSINAGHLLTFNTPTVDWYREVLVDAPSNSLMVDWSEGNLYDESLISNQYGYNIGNASVQWVNRVLSSPDNNNNSQIVIDWSNKILQDINQNYALTWESGNRFLYDNSGNSSVDYSNRILSGTWNAQSLIYSNPVMQASGVFSIPTNVSVCLVNTSISGATGMLADATGLSGYIIIVKDWKGNSFNNNIILTGTNSQTFDGQLNFTINANYMSVNLISDGQNWCLV